MKDGEETVRIAYVQTDTRKEIRMRTHSVCLTPKVRGTELCDVSRNLDRYQIAIAACQHKINQGLQQALVFHGQKLIEIFIYSQRLPDLMQRRVSHLPLTTINCFDAAPRPYSQVVPDALPFHASPAILSHPTRIRATRSCVNGRVVIRFVLPFILDALARMGRIHLPSVNVRDLRRKSIAVNSRPYKIQRQEAAPDEGVGEAVLRGADIVASSHASSTSTGARRPRRPRRTMARSSQRML